MSISDLWKGVAGVAVVALIVGLMIGWVMNLATIIVYYNYMQIGELLVRLVGLFVAPLGGIMGYM